MTNQVLVSACLLGLPVRYDGRSVDAGSEILLRWREEGRIVSICPEVAGGLGVPRPRAEIVDGDGTSVLDADARVVTEHGDDVTAKFEAGAQQALSLVRELGIEVAVLKEHSPSCGSTSIYDGTFRGVQRSGVGVTTALLRREGVTVFGESELEQADAFLRDLE